MGLFDVLIEVVEAPFKVAEAGLEAVEDIIDAVFDDE